MRKLGILIAITAAATLGIAGTASAQVDLPVDVPVDAANGHEETLCPAIDGVVGTVVGGGLPADDTQKGLNETCTTSNQDDGLLPSPTLCGIQKDITDGGGADIAAVVDQVHGTLAGATADLPGVNLKHPCSVGGDDNGGTKTTSGGKGGGSDVQANNAAADGSLPRTGGELFAGAGFGLLSLGALVRRFIG